MAFGLNAVYPGTVDSPSLKERIVDLADKMGSIEQAQSFLSTDNYPVASAVPTKLPLCVRFLLVMRLVLSTGQAINIDVGIKI